ncbi:hypothetical protein COT29_00670, partial [Candidatus Micrarchaeota archaeon CG08_land_8_20_14_0_20_59_11]
PPAITPQYGGIVEFSKKIALKEVIAGTAGVETIELKNNAITPQAVSFDLSGAPTGFISTGANALMLEPGKGGTLTLAFSIPEDARAGDYLVKFTASNPGTRTVDYMVLRVKSIPEGHANPVTTKTIYIYSRTRTTEVRLSVVNPSSKKVERIQMFDQIPSDVATDPSQITFSEKVGVVVSSQPLELAWEFKDLQPGEHATVAYIVNNALEEYSPYAESTVRTATFSTERARGLLNIQEFNVPLMTLGKASSVTALLFYGGMDSAQVTVYLEAPLSGFSVKPERKQVLLAPRSVTRVSFEVTPTSSDAVGSGIVALVVSSDEFTLRQTALFIVKPLLGPDWQFLALAVAAVVVVAFILGRTILRRRRRTLERQFRKEAVEERDGYLKSVRDSILENE